MTYRDSKVTVGERICIKLAMTDWRVRFACVQSVLVREQHFLAYFSVTVMEVHRHCHHIYILCSQARHATEVDAICGWLRARPGSRAQLIH